MCKTQKHFFAIQTLDTLNQNYMEVIEEEAPGSTQQYVVPGQETNIKTSDKLGSG